MCFIKELILVPLFHWQKQWEKICRACIKTIFYGKNAPAIPFWHIPHICLPLTKDRWCNSESIWLSFQWLLIRSLILQFWLKFIVFPSINKANAEMALYYRSRPFLPTSFWQASKKLKSQGLKNRQSVIYSYAFVKA